MLQPRGSDGKFASKKETIVDDWAGSLSLKNEPITNKRLIKVTRRLYSLATDGYLASSAIWGVIGVFSLMWGLFGMFYNLSLGSIVIVMFIAVGSIMLSTHDFMLYATFQNNKGDRIFHKKKCKR